MLSLRAEEERALLTSSLAKAKVMQEHFLHQCSKGSLGAHLLRVPPEGHSGSARSTWGVFHNILKIQVAFSSLNCSCIQ